MKNFRSFFKCIEYFANNAKIPNILQVVSKKSRISEKMMKKYHKFKIYGTKLSDIWKEPVTYKTYLILGNIRYTPKFSKILKNPVGRKEIMETLIFFVDIFKKLYQIKHTHIMQK